MSPFPDHDNHPEKKDIMPEGYGEHGSSGSFLQNLSVAKKLVLGLGVILLIAVIMGGVGISALHGVNARMDRADDSSRLVKYILDLRGEEKNYILRGSADEADDVRKILDIIDTQITQTQAQRANAENDEMMDRLSQVAEDYEKKFNRFVEIDRGADKSREKMEEAAREVENALADFRARQKEQVRNLLNRQVGNSAILEELREADAANRMVKLMLEMRRDEKNYQLRGDEKSVSQVRSGADRLRAQAQMMKKNADRASTRDVADNVLKELADYLSAFDTYVKGRQEQSAIRPLLVKDARILEETAENLRKDEKVELIAQTRLANAQMTGALIAAVVATLLIAFLLTRAIAHPLVKMTDVMQRLAGDDTEVDVPSRNRRDEVGYMARAVQVFKENAIERRQLEKNQKEAEERAREENRRAMNELADDFDSRVGKIVESVNKAARDMQQMSAQLASAVEETSQQSGAVASASQQATANVQTVASAAEEMTSSIQEISRNISDTAEAAKSCAETARMSQDKLDQLSQAVGEIDSVIQSINDVAEQTNLLALNATIEAARAGDAGKGFAVVANEVKALAGQTHKMTDEISRRVGHVKTSADETISSVGTIMDQIMAVDEKTTNVASAIEEQNATTSEISRNAQEAAKGTDEVSSNIEGIQQAASESAGATEQLRGASDDLAAEADNLSKSVKTFLNQVRSG